MTGFYERLIMMLRKECEAGNLSRDEHNVIVELLNKAMLRVFGKNEMLREEVKEMTEPLLELEVDKYIAMVKRAETERDEMAAERDELRRQLSVMQAQIAALTAEQKG